MCSTIRDEERGRFDIPLARTMKNLRTWGDGAEEGGIYFFLNRRRRWKL